MVDTKLIIIEGIPGSGKSTTGEMLKDHLISQHIDARFYHEMEDNHPLRIYDWVIESLQPVEEAQRFHRTVTQLYDQFVENSLQSETVDIIESYLFQDTICFAYMMGMDHTRIHALFESITDILRPLNPSLVFYQQMDVERNWRWICNIRGPEFTEGRCSIYTDADFVRAGEDWDAIQDFALRLIDKWNFRKLIIQNHDYRWSEYRQRILEFLHLAD